MSQRALVNHYFGSENCACLHWAQAVTVRSQDLWYKLKVHATTCIGLAIHHNNDYVFLLCRCWPSQKWTASETRKGTIKMHASYHSCTGNQMQYILSSLGVYERASTNMSLMCWRHHPVSIFVHCETFPMAVKFFWSTQLRHANG